MLTEFLGRVIDIFSVGPVYLTVLVLVSMFTAH